MFRFSSFIIKHRISVVIILALLMIPSLAGIILTKNNYDIMSYMPENMNSRQGEKLLEEKFELSGLGLIMITGMDLHKAEKLKNSIEAVDGVKKVLWLDDFTDTTVPFEFMNPDIRDRYISGDSTLLQVQFEENSRSLKTGKAVKEIHEIIGDKPLFGGEPVVINDLQRITEKEKVMYMLIALVAIYVLLSLSTTSLIEPLLFLISVGVAILLNMGTNVVKGEISFITASIAAVMQLGISMDYSIFLLHRFEEEKQKTSSVSEAMISAMSKSGMAVASSALTTIAGFAALSFMKNGIGADLGFVLGKGIITSLIINVTLLPCLILIFYPLSDKYRHKVILPTFSKSSKWIIKGRWVFLALLILVSAPSFLAQSNLDYYYTNDHYLPETSRSVTDTKKISETFGATEIVYVITKDEGRLKEKKLVEKIKEIDVVKSVLSISEQVDLAIPDSFIPSDLSESFKKDGYRYFPVLITTSADDKRTFDAIEKIRKYAGEEYPEYYVTGSAALAKDLAELVSTDTRNVTIISIGLIALILGISFASISLPLLLILVIELAIWINLSIPYFQGSALSSYTSIIIGAIQLGATVDYAILFTSRYKENINSFVKRVDALKQTIEDTGRSILTSALTMFAATVGISAVTSIKTTGELTLLIGRGAVISMVVIFLGLPSILLIFDKPIHYTTRNWCKTLRK